MNTIQAQSEQEFQARVSWMLASGYGITLWQPGVATLVKPKQISVAALVILLLLGWLLLWIPLIVYLIAFALSSDQRVTIVLTPTAIVPTALPAAVGLRSDDGRWWWDGQRWQAVS